MDWTEKLEHKKKIRKMAYRMLWADFKDTLFGWKIFLVVLMYFGYFLLPYVRKADDINVFTMYYITMWVIMAISALAETSFNYLPLSTKDIVYYLKIRTNHLNAWMVFISGVSAIIVDACKQDVFWERGLMYLLFLLITMEMTLLLTLSGYSKPRGTTSPDSYTSLGRKVRMVIYTVFAIAALFSCMIMGMFSMERNANIKLLVALGMYLVMHIFRADVVRWVRFDEFNKTPGRSMWGNVEAQNQK